MSFLKNRELPVDNPITGAVSDHISALSQQVLIELTRSDDPIDVKEYITMLNRDPVAGSCVELKALRASIAIGNYKNSIAPYQKFMQDNFAYMSGTLPDIVGKMSHAMALGSSVAEIIFKKSCKNEYMLKGFNVLDPTKVSYEGSSGEIKFVVYNSITGKRRIPYKKCLHITGGFTTNFNNPFGVAECRRAYPFYKAKQVILAEMTIAAKNNATGIWVGFTDNTRSVVLYGPNGVPIKDSKGNIATESAGQNLLRQLNNLENNNTLVTDLGNRIESRQINSGEQFWNLVLNILDNQISRAFNVPALTFSEGSGAIGQGQLSVTQKGVMDNTVESMVLQLKDQLIEKVARPLLSLKYGYIADYGSFESAPVNDQATKSAALQNILSAVASQVIDPNSIAVKKKVLDLLDLPMPSEEEIKNLQLIETVGNNQKQQELLATLNASTQESPNQETIQNNNEAGSTMGDDPNYINNLDPSINPDVGSSY